MEKAGNTMGISHEYHSAPRRAKHGSVSGKLRLLGAFIAILLLAYAITAHKSQGSEYRAVIFVPFAGAPMLLTRGVLYTAITRARQLLILVGNEEVVAQMTHNNRRNRRYSGLRWRLGNGGTA